MRPWGKADRVTRDRSCAMIMQSAKRSIACLLLLAGPVLGEAYLARDGKPMAEIVLSPAPARTGRLAAQEQIGRAHV